MVHPRMVRHNQREQMVIAAVRPVKEGDCGTAAVRQTEAKRLFIIIDRTTDISGEQRKMRQITGVNLGSFRVGYGASQARTHRSCFETALGTGRRLFSDADVERQTVERSEEHTSELQSLMRISYAVFCLK